MKKALILFLSISLLALPACGNDAPAVSDALPSSSPSASSPSPESTQELTGNAFLDAEVEIGIGGDGFRAYIEMEKSDALSAGMDAYLDFLSQRVEGSAYNWWTILFEDGTGIVYVGSLPYAAEYGKIDRSDGTVSEVYGAIIPEEDGTYSYLSIDDEIKNFIGENSDGAGSDLQSDAPTVFGDLLDVFQGTWGNDGAWQIVVRNEDVYYICYDDEEVVEIKKRHFCFDDYGALAVASAQTPEYIFSMNDSGRLVSEKVTTAAPITNVYDKISDYSIIPSL